MATASVTDDLESVMSLDSLRGSSSSHSSGKPAHARGTAGVAGAPTATAASSSRSFKASAEEPLSPAARLGAASGVAKPPSSLSPPAARANYGSAARVSADYYADDEDAVSGYHVEGGGGGHAATAHASDKSANPALASASSPAASSPAPASSKAFYVKVLLMLTLWYAGSAAKSVINKSIFKHFHYPLTILQSQLVLQASFTGLIILVFKYVVGFDLVSLSEGPDAHHHGHAHGQASAQAVPAGDSGAPDVRVGGDGTLVFAGSDGMDELESGKVRRLGDALGHKPFPMETTEEGGSGAAPAGTGGRAGAKGGSMSLAERTWVILPFTALHLAAHLFSQFSLSMMPVWMLKVVKSVSPLFTMALSYLVLGDTFDGWMVLSLLPIIAGVVLSGVDPSASHAKTELRVAGILLGVGAAVTYVGEKIAAKKLFNQRLANPFHLLVHSNLIAALVMVPAWLYVDVRAGIRVVSSDTVPLLVANGLVDSALGLGMLLVLTQMSALSHQIAAAGDRVVVMVVSVIFFKNYLSPEQISGIVVCCVGMAAYQRAKYHHDQIVAAAAATAHQGFQKGPHDAADLASPLSSRLLGGSGGGGGGGGAGRGFGPSSQSHKEGSRAVAGAGSASAGYGNSAAAADARLARRKAGRGGRGASGGGSHGGVSGGGGSSDVDLDDSRADAASARRHARQQPQQQQQQQRTQHSVGTEEDPDSDDELLRNLEAEMRKASSGSAVPTATPTGQVSTPPLVVTAGQRPPQR